VRAKLNGTTEPARAAGDPRRRKWASIPLQGRGIPLEKQFRNWSELNVKPYDKNSVDPYTQYRVIKEHRERIGGEYRSEPLGEHPIASARQAVAE
jgi:hypothetical protein